MNIHYVCYIKHSEISLALLRDLTITIILAKFETNLKVHIVRKYLLQVYILQRWQKYYYFTKSTFLTAVRTIRQFFNSKYRITSVCIFSD